MKKITTVGKINAIGKLIEHEIEYDTDEFAEYLHSDLNRSKLLYTTNRMCDVLCMIDSAFHGFKYEKAEKLGIF